MISASVMLLVAVALEKSGKLNKKRHTKYTLWRKCSKLESSLREVSILSWTRRNFSHSFFIRKFKIILIMLLTGSWSTWTMHSRTERISTLSSTWCRVVISDITWLNIRNSQRSKLDFSLLVCCWRSNIYTKNPFCIEISNLKIWYSTKMATLKSLI